MAPEASRQTPATPPNTPTKSSEHVDSPTIHETGAPTSMLPEQPGIKTMMGPSQPLGGVAHPAYLARGAPESSQKQLDVELGKLSSRSATPPPTPGNEQMGDVNDLRWRWSLFDRAATGAYDLEDSATSTLVGGSETGSSVRLPHIPSADKISLDDAQTAPIGPHQLIHLDTGDKTHTAEEIHSNLVATGLRYFVLTMFPVNKGLWELVVVSSSLDKIRTYFKQCGFDINEHSLPSRGLSVRALIIRHQDRQTQDAKSFLKEAALFYDDLLRSYSYLSVLIDIASAIVSIPISVVM